VPDVAYDLDCDEVSGSNFSVVGDDVNGFDGDGDRIACETWTGKASKPGSFGSSRSTGTGPQTRSGPQRRR
jgi:hypothetical protein